MAFANNPRRVAEAVAVVMVSALLVYFGNGLEPRWPLMWLAPLPVLWLTLRGPWWEAALVAGVAWLIGCTNLWGYFRLLGMPPAAWVAVFGVAATVFAVAVLLFRTLVLRGAVWSALVAVPVMWVSFEYVRNLLWPHGTAGCLAYSQLKFLPFLQLASIAGPWGMGFVLLLFPAGVAIGLHFWRAEPGQAARVLSVTLGTVAAVLIFGAVRLALAQPGPVVRVGLATSDAPGMLRTARAGAGTERLLHAYAGEVRALAQQGAQAIVLPEHLVTVTDADAAGADRILQRVADDSGATIVAGVDYEATAVAFNQARVYRQEVNVASYDKEHMLPPFELKFTPGKERLLLHKATGTWGVEICKDMDFTPLARQYGRADVGLMLAPAWDFNVDRDWHGHIAVMRGVEDGFSVVRAAKNGYLTVSDNRGRIVAERRSDEAPFVTLLAEVPAGHSTTLFLLLGDWFAWVSVAVLALVLVRLWV